MTQEKHPKFQSLMNEAHDVWKTVDTGKDFGALLRELTPLQRVAFSLGKLNYQVENGGFSQWHFNGYSQMLDDARWAAQKVGGELAEKVLALLDDFEGALDDVDEPVYDEYDEESETLDDVLEVLDVDSKYYSFNGQWVDAIEAYLVAQAAA